MDLTVHRRMCNVKRDLPRTFFSSKTAPDFVLADSPSASAQSEPDEKQEQDKMALLQTKVVSSQSQSLVLT